MKVPDRALLAIAIVGGGVCLALTTIASKTPRGLDDLGFLVGVLLWGVAPYYGVVLLASTLEWGGTVAGRRFFQRGLLAYLFFDALIRTTALFFPQSATDALVVLFLPAWSVVIVGVGGLLSLALMRWVERRGA